VEVCHIETPTGKEGRLEREKRNGKMRGKTKRKTRLNRPDAESVAGPDPDELESEEEDGIQECLPGKKRKSHSYDNESRLQKKVRIE